MKTLAIAGVGLIGGSFALAVRKAGFTGKILGVSSPASLKEALARGVIDEAASLEEAAARADVIYLSQTIHRIIESLPVIGAIAGPDTLITDAGSTKARIIAEAAQHIRGAQFQSAQFLGGHPLAGKEARGVEAADADLFQGRTYVLTPSAPADLETPAAADFLAWIGKIGAIPVTLSADAHDRTVASTSHLPQLAATALAATLAERGEDLRALAGPGLIDATRLALSSYDIWKPILETNRAAVEEALTAYIRKLESMRAVLGDDELRSDFESAAEFVGRLRRANRN